MGYVKKYMKKAFCEKRKQRGDFQKKQQRDPQTWEEKYLYNS